MKFPAFTITNAKDDLRNQLKLAALLLIVVIPPFLIYALMKLNENFYIYIIITLSLAWIVYINNSYISFTNCSLNIENKIITLCKKEILLQSFNTHDIRTIFIDKVRFIFPHFRLKIILTDNQSLYVQMHKRYLKQFINCLQINHLKFSYEKINP